MTLQEIKDSTSTFLTPADVATVLECQPQLIRVMAKTDPRLLGFPVIVLGSRTRIPRKPFLAYLGEETES